MTKVIKESGKFNPIFDDLLKNIQTVFSHEGNVYSSNIPKEEIEVIEDFEVIESKPLESEVTNGRK